MKLINNFMLGRLNYPPSCIIENNPIAPEIKSHKHAWESFMFNDKKSH